MAEWIAALATAAAAFIAYFAADVGLKTFKRQRTTSDVELSLSIFSEINRYWDRLSDGNGPLDYNMGQVLAHFEIAAALFNKSVLTEEATSILGDHITEVFSRLKSSPEGESLLERCRSAASTFEELNKFLRARMPQALNVLDYHHKTSEPAAAVG